MEHNLSVDISNKINTITKIDFSNNSLILSKIDKDVIVNYPLSVNQTDSGYDMFVPELTKPIIDKFIEINKFNLEIDDDTIIYLVSQDGTESLTYMKDTKEYIIDGYVMLPTGIQFLFPSIIYGRLCNRSSNSKYNINIIEATIDNQHSNNCCFQIAKLNPNKIIRFTAGDRIGQMILTIYYKYPQLNVDTEVFNNKPRVIQNRTVRSGNGIGSTGK